VPEAPGTVTIDVQLTNVTDKDVKVYLAVTPIDAEAGSDYLVADNLIVIPVGQTTGSMDITILDDDVNEEFEALNVFITRVKKGLVGPTNSILLTLGDNDPATSFELYNLLYNADFEIGVEEPLRAAEEYPWRVNNAIGTLLNDKIACKGKGNAGSDCAFLFKGGPGEYTALSYKDTIDWLSLEGTDNGIVPSYAGLLKGAAIPANLKSYIKITYSDDTTKQKYVLPPMEQVSIWQRPEGAPVVFGSTAVKKLLFKFIFTGTAGSVLVDDVRALLFLDGVPMRADGWRGQ
jgi:hypothetical protein